MVTIHTFQSMVHTSDNWYPNYPDNEVVLSLHIPSKEFLKEYDGDCYKYRVSVWGADDFGMERDFYDEGDLHSALNLYATVKKLGSITIQQLKELSFQAA